MSHSATPWTAACQAFLFLTISQGLPKFMFIRSVMPSSYLILWLLFFCPWSFPPSGTSPMSHLCASDDQNTRASASASVLPVNIQGWSPSRLTGLKKKKIDWFDHLAVQGTFRSLLQHHSSKASILWRSAFFTVQLSCDHLEDQSLDYTDLCLQSNFSAFQHTV